MIFRELAEPAVAQQIGAAVAHLADEKPRLEQCQRGDRRPHSPFVVLGQRALKDRAIRRTDRGAHPLGDLLVGQATDRMDLIGDNPHCHLTGDFARGMSSHAVGNDKNPPVGNHAKTVLVPRPDDAHVGAACGSDVHVIPR